MTSDLMAFVSGNTLPILSDDALADAIEQAQRRTGEGVRDTTFTQYLSFSGKTGAYALGKDRDDVDPEALYLVEPMSFTDGWICWKSSRPVDRVEWNYIDHQRAVVESDLQDHGPYNSAMGEGWSTLLGLGCISLDNKMTQIKFSSNSVSARNSISDLHNEIKARARRGEAQIPIIHFDRQQFEAQGAKNWKPNFVVEVWVTRESASSYATGGLTLGDLVSGVPVKKVAKQK
tara:strand:- start:1267 stop:1962 length:696 start_codon:yes stop_codon:yes gene_type:complete